MGMQAPTKCQSVGPGCSRTNNLRTAQGLRARIGGTQGFRSRRPAKGMVWMPWRQNSSIQVAPTNLRTLLVSGRPLMAEDGTAALNRGALMYCCGEDKPDRPAEMPERDHEGSQLNFRGQNNCLQLIFTQSKCQPATSASCVSDLAGSKTLCTQTRPLIAEDGTAAHHRFWLNLDRKDGVWTEGLIHLYQTSPEGSKLQEDDLTR
ncbi:hypothetical protein Bbelb_306850 [Branchiostoma belcheri]|nr:hypothetical protein Bbelb_306850 [Branchiostoma belcheri]